MTEEKKVSEIVIAMDSKVDEILAYIKDLHFKYSIILARLDKHNVPASVSPPMLHNQKSSVTLPTRTQLVGLTEGPSNSPFASNPNLKDKIKQAIAQAEDEDLADFPQVAIKMEGQRRNLRVHGENQKRQIPVEQRIITAENKPIYMANVVITDMEGNLVTKSSTNQAGKWLSSLPPGEYQVNINKSATAVKSKVELQYSIIVPEQDSKVELETKKVV